MLDTILEHIENLGYKVAWKVLDAQFFGVPQARKRIYIVGTFKDYPNLENFNHSVRKLGDILERGLPTEHSEFIDNLLAHYSVEELEGKSIKDKLAVTIISTAGILRLRVRLVKSKRLCSIPC